MKYLHNKPIRNFKGDEYLRLAQAEQDHLMEFKITSSPVQSLAISIRISFPGSSPPPYKSLGMRLH